MWHHAVSWSFWAMMGMLLAAGTAQADESLKGKACRSVHLQLPGPAGTAFYHEGSIEQSAQGTYVCMAGFNFGYFGLQELGDGKKTVIFSVWEPGAQNDPNTVEEDRRVKLLYKAPEVRVGRFGNEGTGGQSFFDYDWKIGQNYRFLLAAQPDGARTAFAAYFYLPDQKQWKHLATFSTLTGGKHLGGYYAFVEDFRRNRISAGQTRRAQFGFGWVRGTDGKWTRLDAVRFTADSNPDTHINARLIGERFELSTGGEVQNTDAPLKSTLNRKASNDPQAVEAQAPADLPTPLFPAANPAATAPTPSAEGA